MSDRPIGPCKLCGRSVYFAKIEGKDDLVPLDMTAPTFRLFFRDGRPCAERSPGFLVSHFSTCRGIAEGKRP